MNMDMMFGLYTAFIKWMLKAKGLEEATLSITHANATRRAEEFEKLANSSRWFKKDKLRKAEFYNELKSRLAPRRSGGGERRRGGQRGQQRASRHAARCTNALV